MDQAEFWRRCEQDFLRYSNEDNEKLVIRWDATHGDTWSFEGTPYSARAFKTLANQSGNALLRKSSPEAWKEWLDALRRHNYDPRVPQTLEARLGEEERRARGLMSSLGRSRGALATAILKRQDQEAGRAVRLFEASSGSIGTPFRTSALLCLEKAAEPSIDANEPEQPPSWVDYLLDPSVELGESETDAMEVQEPPQRARPGPETDTETAQRVLEIVTRITGSRSWRSKLEFENICEALDEEKIPRPKTWLRRDPPIRSWTDATTTTDRELAKKAIKHHLKNAGK